MFLERFTSYLDGTVLLSLIKIINPTNWEACLEYVVLWATKKTCCGWWWNFRKNISTSRWGDMSRINLGVYVFINISACSDAILPPEFVTCATAANVWAERCGYCWYSLALAYYQAFVVCGMFALIFSWICCVKKFCTTEHSYLLRTS